MLRLHLCDTHFDEDASIILRQDLGARIELNDRYKPWPHKMFDAAPGIGYRR